MNQCLGRTSAYFECGQQSHMARDCPRRRRGQPQLPPPPMGHIRGFALENALQGGSMRPLAQGTVYTITRGQAEDAPDVIIGYLKGGFIPKLLPKQKEKLQYEPSISKSLPMENPFYHRQPPYCEQLVARLYCKNCI